MLDIEKSNPRFRILCLLASLKEGLSRPSVSICPLALTQNRGKPPKIAGIHLGCVLTHIFARLGLFPVIDVLAQLAMKSETAS